VAVDVVRVGRSFRALRLRLGLRQRDVAARAGVSQQHVSDLERGQVGRMSFDAAAKLFAVLDARLVVSVSWRGAQLDRLLDEAHAAVVAATVTRLQADGWEVLPEVTYAVYRERGSVDILAWHAASRTLLVIEVKTEIASAEETLRRHDEKVRLAPKLGRERFGVGYVHEPSTGGPSRAHPRSGLPAPWRRGWAVAATAERPDGRAAVRRSVAARRIHRRPRSAAAGYHPLNRARAVNDRSRRCVNPNRRLAPLVPVAGSNSRRRETRHRQRPYPGQTKRQGRASPGRVAAAPVRRRTLGASPYGARG
jgi:transcriptional regulator with XRE-family HTH domain